MQQDSGFQVFIVSLDRAADRRAYMRNLIARLGLEANFVSAVDGRNLTAAQRACYSSPHARRVYGCDMTDGEIACYLSHLQVYRRMVEQGIETALILEDDITCVANLKSVVEDVMRLSAPAWQVMRLQSTKQSVSMPDEARGYGKLVGKAGGREVFRIRTSVLGGCAYLIRSTAAAAMLARSRRIEMPIDQTLDRYWENGIVPYVVRPMPVWHDDRFPSEIGERGRRLAPRSPSSIVLQRRAQRLVDSFNKRVFWIAFRVPSFGH